jgi:hypothetical protein
MRRRWFVIGVTAVLVGCGTGGDISRNRPTFTGETTKLDAVYARCVQARWAAIAPSARILETSTALHVVVSNATTQQEELLVIHARIPSGADVALYERVQVLALRAYREAAKACL